MNRVKLASANAYAATSTATAADKEAIANPRLRPSLRINNVAGMVVAATATTIIEIGSVDQAGLRVKPAPIIPPNVITTMEPVAEISWQVTRMTRLPFCIHGAARKN